MRTFLILLLTAVVFGSTPTVYTPPTLTHPPALNYAWNAGVTGSVDRPNFVGGGGGGAVVIDDDGFTYVAIETSKSFPIGSVNFDEFDYTIFGDPTFGTYRTLLVKLSPAGTPLIGASSFPSATPQSFFPFELQYQNSLLFLSGYFLDAATHWIGDDGIHNITLQRFEQNTDIDGFILALNATTLKAVWGAVLSLNASIVSSGSSVPQSLIAVPCPASDHLYTAGWWAVNLPPFAATLKIREQSYTSAVDHLTCDSLAPSSGGYQQPFVMQISASTGQFKAALCPTEDDARAVISSIVVDTTGQIYAVGNTIALTLSWDSETGGGGSVSVHAPTSSNDIGFILAISPTVYANSRLRAKWVLPLTSDTDVYAGGITIDLQSNLIVTMLPFVGTYFRVADRFFTPDMCGSRPSTDGSNMIDLSNGQYTVLSGNVIFSISNIANSSIAPTTCNWMTHLCGSGTQTGYAGLEVDPVTGLIYHTHNSYSEWSVIATTNATANTTTVTGCCGGPSEGASGVSFNRFDPKTGLPQFSYGFATADLPNGYVFNTYQPLAVHPVLGGAQIVMALIQYNEQNITTEVPFFNTTYAPYWGLWDGMTTVNHISAVPAFNQYLLLVAVNDKCVQSPCQNGGTCQNTPQSAGGFTCSCPPAFTGNTCSIVVTDCSSTPCVNGGACQPRIGGGFVCNCVAGYSGVQCNTNINECNSNPCLNNGVCMDFVNSFLCQCSGGYGGAFCETDINECTSMPCQNAGTCVDGINQYQCLCRAGFSDVSCQTQIDNCVSTPCQNGGTCVTGIDRFDCQCVKGYIGSLCETDINECVSMPCQNGGTCVDGINRYTCTCLIGFGGIQCETVLACSSNPCLNGATFVNLISGCSCTCATGWSGPFCEININECLPSSPCESGSTCVDGIGTYICICPYGFALQGNTGTHCVQDFRNHGPSHSYIHLPTADAQLIPNVNNYNGGGGWTVFHTSMWVRFMELPDTTKFSFFTGHLQWTLDTSFDLTVAPTGSPSFAVTSSGTDVVTPHLGLWTFWYYLSDYQASQNQYLFVEDQQLGVRFCDQSGGCQPPVDGGTWSFQCGGRCYLDEFRMHDRLLYTSSQAFHLDFFTMWPDAPATSGFLFEVVTWSEQTGTVVNDWTNAINVGRFPQFSAYQGWGQLSLINGAEWASSTYDGYCTPSVLKVFASGTVRSLNLDPSITINNRDITFGFYLRTDAFFTTDTPPDAISGIQGFHQDIFRIGPHADDNSATYDNSILRFDLEINSRFCVSSYPSHNTQADLGPGIRTVNAWTVQDMSEWHHWLVTMHPDGSQLVTNIYRDGALVSTEQNGVGGVIWGATPTTINPQQIRFGSSAFAISDFRLYQDFIMSADDVAVAWYTKNFTTRHLVLWFPFNETSGVFASDYSGLPGNAPANFSSVSSDAMWDSSAACPVYPTYPSLCASSPCLHGATCIDGINGFACTCTSGFSGAICQTDINECASNPCQGAHSVCVDRVNSYSCVCVDGFIGSLCETNVNECVSHPCQSGGSCVDGINQWMCRCPVGYSGLLCQTNMNECASQPCRNGGTCIDFVNQFLCQCTPGFSGTQCQTDVNECLSLPCLNGATCSDDINRYQCQCPHGFTGFLCETDINECSSQPCSNQGNCTDLVDGFVCNCTLSFFGTFCENQTVFLSETETVLSSSSSTASSSSASSSSSSQSTPLQSLKDLTSGASIATFAVTAVATLLPLLSIVQTFTTAVPALSYIAAASSSSSAAASVVATSTPFSFI